MFIGNGNNPLQQFLCLPPAAILHILCEQHTQLFSVYIVIERNHHLEKRRVSLNMNRVNIVSCCRGCLSIKAEKILYLIDRENRNKEENKLFFLF